MMKFTHISPSVDIWNLCTHHHPCLLQHLTHGCFFFPFGMLLLLTVVTLLASSLPTRKEMWSQLCYGMSPFIVVVCKRVCYVHPNLIKCPFFIHICLLIPSAVLCLSSCSLLGCKLTIKDLVWLRLQKFPYEYVMHNLYSCVC